MAESKDIEINQFPIVSSLSNKDYVVVSLDDGTQGRIKTSDLASVVAGVVNNDMFLKSALLSTLQGDMSTGSCDDLLPGGIYSIREGVSNRPSDETGTGLAITLGLMSSYRFQIYSSGSNNNYYIRKFIYGEWGPWNKFT